jgi:hypothetical protein
MSDKMDLLEKTLQDAMDNYPKALEAAWQEGFLKGSSAATLKIVKTGNIECGNIPYEEFFNVSETKGVIDTINDTDRED